MDATHAKVQISRWKDLFVPFQWKLPTTASKDKVPNVDSAYRVSVASLLQRPMPDYPRSSKRYLRRQRRHDRHPKLLRAVASGSGCYIHIVENTALNLKKTAQIRGELKGLKSLDHLAELFGITDEDIYVKAEKVADSVLADLYKPEYVSAELIEKIAYAPRIKRWKELGIMPGGAKAEVFKGVVKCSTNLNSDPVDMLTDCLNLEFQQAYTD